MLYNDPKVIFIHIPKTAGSSLEHLFAGTPWLHPSRDGRMGQHSNLQSAYDIYGDLSEYKTFTVIRNTYHRIVSLYCMNYSRGGGGFRRMGLFNNQRENYATFPMFYERLLDVYRNQMENRHVQDAQDYFFYNAINGVVPEFVEHVDFENIENSFTELWCDKWGFELSQPLPHKMLNLKLVKDNTLRDYLLRDPTFLKIMEEVYEKEIKHFGFKPY